MASPHPPRLPSSAECYSSPPAGPLRRMCASFFFLPLSLSLSLSLHPSFSLSLSHPVFLSLLSFFVSFSIHCCFFVSFHCYLVSIGLFLTPYSLSHCTILCCSAHTQTHMETHTYKFA